jgi:hypothetical protein
MDLEAIRDDVLILRGGETRAVLTIQGINLALKSPDEREAILHGYRSFLNGLEAPVQVVCAILHRNLDGYLADLRAATADQRSPALARLAMDHHAFVQQLSARRTLMHRWLYLVVSGPALHVGSSTRRLVPFGPRRSAMPEVDDEGFVAARRQLGARTEELRQQLQALGLGARRLGGDGLSQAIDEILAPERAVRQRVMDGGAIHAMPVVRTALTREIARASA